MSEGIFVIELGDYGFLLDTAWCYVALSWEFIVSAAVIATAVIVFKRCNKRK